MVLPWCTHRAFRGVPLGLPWCGHDASVCPRGAFHDASVMLSWCRHGGFHRASVVGPWRVHGSAVVCL